MVLVLRLRDGNNNKPDGPLHSVLAARRRCRRVMALKMYRYRVCVMSGVAIVVVVVVVDTVDLAFSMMSLAVKAQLHPKATHHMKIQMRRMESSSPIPAHRYVLTTQVRTLEFLA